MVIVFCILLISGIVAGQAIDLGAFSHALHAITSVCLAFIMIEVGLEFTSEKRSITSYGFDAFVASSAAILPALLWFLYFVVVFDTPIKPALVSGLSCAPTSAGVLFSMLMAAGLSLTWVYQKARTLAVLDDLVTILLLTPLQLIITGFNLGSIIVVGLILFFLFASFRWQNTLKFSTDEKSIFLYAIILTGLIAVVKTSMHIHLEVLVPAFMLGCMIKATTHEKPSKETNRPWLGSVIKGAFMFLVGLSFPKVQLANMPIATTFWHVFVLTVLSNLGKCFSLFCYRKDATVKERLALSIAMFPRGEVGAAVLLIGLGFGYGGYVTSLALLSLAFNLILTGAFIWCVIQLIKK